MRILGVDPGTQRTGWGIVERDGSRVIGVAAGVIRAPKERPLEARLLVVYAGLSEIVERFRPEVVAVESIFHAKYANAAIKLGHVRGVTLLVAAHGGIAVHDYPPALVKRTVAGRGGADKRQIAQLVGAILGWKELPALDATDALAVAITHAQAVAFAAPGAATDGSRAPSRGRGAVATRSRRRGSS